ncbi:hypothetical protein AB3S75_018674 [Citrus x aurantiifolia]
MPHVWDDGALLLGNEKTSVLFVDAKSGRMICSHGSDNSASTLGSGLPCAEEEFRIYANRSEDLLYVMRTDYEIWYYPSDSRDILWQVAFADVKAEFQCQEVVGEYHLNSELTADYVGHAGSTLPCGTRASVHRLHDDDLQGFLSVQGKGCFIRAIGPTIPSISSSQCGNKSTCFGDS